MADSSHSTTFPSAESFDFCPDLPDLSRLTWAELATFQAFYLAIIRTGAGLRTTAGHSERIQAIMAEEKARARAVVHEITVEARSRTPDSQEDRRTRLEIILQAERTVPESRAPLLDLVDTLHVTRDRLRLAHAACENPELDEFLQRAVVRALADCLNELGDVSDALDEIRNPAT